MMKTRIVQKEIIELRESMGMDRREFCSYFEIPYRTVKSWEEGKTGTPAYTIKLMQYKVNMENAGKKRKQ